MGKQSSKKRLRRTGQASAWASLDFANPSELELLRLPEDRFEEWLDGVAQLLVRPLIWKSLTQLESDFSDHIARLDWQRRPTERLVKDLHIVGSIEEGITTFLPKPYRECPLHLRRILYLSIFLMHGIAAIEENPQEHFGLPEYGHWPSYGRMLFPVARPLWFLVAKRHIIEAIRRQRLQHRIATTGALLALLHEAPSQAEARWLPLLDETPDSLLRQLEKRFKSDDWHSNAGPLNMTASQAFFTTKALQGDQNAGQLLAQALAGRFNHFSLAVRHALMDMHDREDVREKYDRFEVIYRDRQAEDPSSKEDLLAIFAQNDISRDSLDMAGEDKITVPEAPSIDDSPEEAVSRRDQQQKLSATLDRISRREPKLGKLIRLYRLNPDLTQEELANSLGLTTETVRNHLKRLRTLLAKHHIS